ncbi:MAG: glycosyltransferase family 39 protein [Methylococcales bacterium]
MRRNIEFIFTSRWIVFVAICVFGLILRLYRLNYQSLWHDESFSIIVSDQPIGLVFERLISDYVHPPLHYLLLHICFLIPDFGPSGARLISAISGTASVPVLYLAGKVFFDNRTASISASILGVSQLAVMYSQEVRPYAQEMLFSCSTLLFFGLAIRTYFLKYWWAFVISALLVLYTHYYSVFLVALLFSWALFFEKRLSPIHVLGGAAVVALVFIPWLANGVVDAAVNNPKITKVPSYFAVSWTTPFKTLNQFNNGNLENVLEEGVPIAYFFGAFLFTTPALFGLGRQYRYVQTTPRQNAMIWTTLAVILYLWCLGTNSGKSGLALSLIPFFRALQILLRSDMPHWAGMSTSRTAWLIVLVSAVVAAQLVSSPPYIFFVLGLLFGHAVYGILVRSPISKHAKKHRIEREDQFTYLLALVSIVPTLVPILLGSMGLQYDTRYSLAGLSAYYLLVARGLSLINITKWRLILVGLSLGYSVIALRANYFSPYKENWRDSLAVLAKNYRTGDCTVFSPFSTLPDEWSVYRYYLQQPSLNIIPLRELDDLVPSCKRVWVLYYSRVAGFVKIRNEATLQIVVKSHRESEYQKFHWIDVGLYEPLN